MNRLEIDDPIWTSMASAHSSLNARHEQTRSRLLNELPDTILACRPVRQSLATSRYLVVGLGLSAVASASFLVVWLLGSTRPAVAIERMAKALDQVTSYSFRMESISVSRNEQGRTVRQVTDGSWRTDPIGLHATIQVVETSGTNSAGATRGKTITLVDLEETHQAGQRGIMVDHLTKEYWWIDEEIDANSIGNPHVLIYMVRQRRGRVVRDLGSKQIGHRVAKGFEIILDDAQRGTELGPSTAEANDRQASQWVWRNESFEVWVDPNTDLPIEFRCTRRRDESETRYLFTNLKWNVEFAAAAMAPIGYKQLDKS